MPRFFFHLLNDVDARDTEGIELPDLEAARKEAFRSAASLIGEEVAERRKIDPRHRIEVEDERQQTVFILNFGDLIGG